MIMNMIKNLVGWVTTVIFSAIDLPLVPEGLVSAMNYLFQYMRQGMGIINFFCPLANISPAIDVFVAVWGGIHGYRIIMWVLRKIPMLGIE